MVRIFRKEISWAADCFVKPARTCELPVLLETSSRIGDGFSSLPARFATSEKVFDAPCTPLHRSHKV
jgi:hypothetical protein